LWEQAHKKGFSRNFDETGWNYEKSWYQGLVAEKIGFLVIIKPNIFRLHL
jgi:hypothetical protein